MVKQSVPNVQSSECVVAQEADRGTHPRNVVQQDSHRRWPFFVHYAKGTHTNTPRGGVGGREIL